MPEPENIQTVPAARIEFRPDDRQWIADRIQEVLASGQLTLGQHGKAFEEGFAELCGVKHAIAVNSGTAALEIALRCVGVEGKDVLVPANTFFATESASGAPCEVLRPQPPAAVGPEGKGGLKR